MPVSHRQVTSIVLLLPLLIIVGCENRVEVLDRSKGSFSVYGGLNLFSDTNYVRVKDLNQPLTDDSTRRLDATVTLTNLSTGTSQTLVDSVRTFDGVNTHNFRTTLDIEPQTSYRVTVEDDSRRTQETTIAPQIATVDAGPTGRVCNVPIRITFDGVEDPENLEVAVGVEYRGRERWTFPGEPDDVEGEDQVSVEFMPIRILDGIFQQCGPFGSLREVWCHDLSRNDLLIRYTHFGEEPEANTDNSNQQRC